MTITAPHERITACRFCSGRNLSDLISFGDSPIADRLMRPSDESAELSAPLTLAICDDCGLCQLRETLVNELLVGPDYRVFTSVSPALVKHFHDSADALIATRDLRAAHLVIEAGSNDGTMLSRFSARGIGVLGIDPAEAPAAMAEDRGIRTLREFLTLDLAGSLAAEGYRADLFLANNVLAQVGDPNDFVAGLETLLAEDGTAVLEFAYLPDMLENCAFDTIYHQHLLYLSLGAAADIFARYGLWVNDAVRLKVHGGSLRIAVSRRPGTSDRLKGLLLREARIAPGDPQTFVPFIAGIELLRRELLVALEGYRARGARVAGYGATSKATTLIHHLGLSRDDIAFIVDRSPWKQGLETPVTRIPIVPPSALATANVDVLVILAWNFANEIMRENAAFADKGGTFLVPVPKVTATTRWGVGVAL